MRLNELYNKSLEAITFLKRDIICIDIRRAGTKIQIDQII